MALTSSSGVSVAGPADVFVFFRGLASSGALCFPKTASIFEFFQSINEAQNTSIVRVMYGGGNVRVGKLEARRFDLLRDRHDRRSRPEIHVEGTVLLWYPGIVSGSSNVWTHFLTDKNAPSWYE